ncbi:MAG: transcriptional regulator [Bacteroidetes bacterium]|nr:MAG: transcriptional regulator [Bacteroidota bacterium]
MDYNKSSQILKALAHPLRLKMVEMLMDDECCVTDVTNALGISQSTASQNLGILKNAGIVYPQKYGTKTCYIVDNDTAKEIINLLNKNHKHREAE